jgi:hypothetical protein
MFSTVPAGSNLSTKQQHDASSQAQTFAIKHGDKNKPTGNGKPPRPNPHDNRIAFWRMTWTSNGDLAAEQGDRVEQLRDRLHQWWDNVGAQLPSTQ